MSKRQLLCNVFGALGYLSCLLQWLWAAVVWLPLVMNDNVKNLLVPDHPAYQLPMPAVSGPSPFLTILAVIVTVVIMLVTVIVLLRTPVAIAKTGQKVTRKSADALLPAITHHKPVTKKERRHLTVRLVKIAKLIFVLLPVLLVFPAIVQHLELSYGIIMLTAGWLAICSVIWFTLQYLLARLLHISDDKLA